MSMQSRYCDHFIYACMVLFAFSLPISIAVSQGALILALLGWAVKIAFEKRFNPEHVPVDYPLLAFLAASVLSALWGYDRANSLAGMRTYWTFLIIYVLYNNIREAGRVKILVGCLLAGGAVMAIYSVAESAFELYSGTEPDLLGDMSQAGQFMLVCGIAGAGLLYKKDLKGRIVFLLIFALLLAGVVLQFKRGSWIGLIFVLIVQGMIKSPKTAGVILAAVLCVFVLYRPARQRLVNVEGDFSPEAGGRAAMWLTAPEMIRDYPMGAGLDNAGTLMYKYDSGIELKEGRVKHTHLHNSYLQVLVELGPLGLGAFIAFLFVFLRFCRGLLRNIPERYPEEKAFVLGSLSSVVGFLANGLVEDNFGDSEVAMVVFFLMGLTFVIGRSFKIPGTQPGGSSIEDCL